MLSTLDVVVIVAYLLGMVLVGYLSGRNNKTQDDYFFANRNMPWIPVALSVAATAISANGFVGGPGWAYSDGMFPFMVNVTVPFAVFFAMFVTVPIIYRMKITSVYEYIGFRFGNYTRGLTIFQFFVNSLIQASSMIFIPVILIATVTGLSISVLIPIVVVISLLYTVMGGIKAVIWTDTIQMIVVIGSVILIIVTAVNHIGAEGLFETLKASGKLDTLDFGFDPTNNNSFWVTLIGGTFMWVRYFCFDQTQVQRVLTARSLGEVKKSFVISAGVMNIVYYLMLFVGTLLFIYFGGKEFESSNEIMITFVLEALPSGIIGLIIAAIFAAAMSSVDSLLNSMVAVFSKDVYEYYFKKKQATLKVTMGFTVAIAAIITVIIYIGFGPSVKSVIDLVGSYISYFSGPAVGVFLLGMLTTKTSDKGAAIGFIIGLIGNITIALTFNTGWLMNPFIGGALTLITGYLLSFIFKIDESKDITEYTAKGLMSHKELEKSERPLYFGIHEKLVLGFFIAQYAVLAIIQF